MLFNGGTVAPIVELHGGFFHKHRSKFVRGGPPWWYTLVYNVVCILRYLVLQPSAINTPPERK